MKLSLSITLAIIAAAAIAGWRNHGELVRLTHTYGQVSQQARALGIQPGSGTPSHRTRSNLPRHRNDGSLAADLIAFAEELETLPEPTDSALLDEREQRMLDWQRRLSALNPAAMKSLIHEINMAGGMKDESKQDLLFLVLQTFADSHPMAALEVVAGSPDLLKNPEARASVGSIALIKGMETDPAASTAWLKSHRDLFPGDLGRRVTERFMRGTSLINPKAAFLLISELEVQDTGYAIAMITNPARTSAQRDATLAAFRQYLTTIQDPAQREALAWEGVSTMISTALFDGVESAIQQIGNGRFTPEEIESYAGRVSFNFREGDAPKWIDWLLENVPTERMSSEIIPRIFADWTSVDYQAAGKWLNNAPEGPAKTGAISNYANSLAEQHPEIAARWALTMIPGENRDQLLPRIYQSWLKTDPSAAASFAEQNGIAK